MDSDTLDLPTALIMLALIPLVVFFVLIIHEWGHYWAAKFFRLSIDEVVIGAGKTVWKSRARKKTRWSLRLYPFWAHVQISGSMNALPVWKKFIVVLAGPAFNLVLPFLLLSVFFMMAGQPATPSILTGVEVGAVADEAGLKPGDQILSVNGQPVQRYAEVHKLAYKEGRKSLLEVRRDSQILKVIVQPSVLNFKDADGIRRSAPRLGVLWQHKPLHLQAVHAVNGIDTKDNQDKARELLIANLDREIILGLHSNDTLVHHYRVRMRSDSNKGLSQPGHKDYKKIFLGEARDDFYFKTTVPENLKAAAVMNVQMIQKVMLMPFQLLPVDPDILTPEYYVYGDETWLANRIYKIIYVVSLASLLMAFFNLLPLPGLDGSLLLFYMIESALRKSLNYRHKAVILGTFCLVFYLCILITNLDNIPGYMDSRIKKLQEYMNSEKHEE